MKGIVVLLSLIAASAPCLADRATAKAAYERGLKQYNLGEYQASLDSFTIAYNEVPDPRLLFNLAQCSRMLGQKTKAVTLYRSYLREIGDEAPNVDEVRRIISILENDLAREQASKQAPPQGPEPAPISPEPKPPVASAPAAPPPTPPQVEAPKPPKPWFIQRRKIGVGLIGGGVVIAAVGAALVGSAPGLAHGSADADSLSDGRSQYDRAGTFNVAGLSLIGVGAAVAVAGVVVIALPQREASLHAWISPSGVGIRGKW